MPAPLIPFLRRLHRDGVSIHEAMYLLGLGGEYDDATVRRRPLWTTIARLVVRHVSDLGYVVNVVLRTPKGEADRMRRAERDAQFAAWERELGPRFFDWPRIARGDVALLMWQAKRLGERKSDKRAELCGEWPPKGFQGGHLGLPPREYTIAALRAQANTLRAEADQLEAGPARDVEKAVRTSPR